jgi:hypothetical protein
MFRRSASSSQPDLFSSFEAHFKGHKQKQLNDPQSWHNVFYDQVTSKIDESAFGVLYDAATGRPNAPIRQLVSMMILKEGFGWSDSELFEQCRFNILVMRALGLMNLSDEIPVESTYYLFKRGLYAYQLQYGEDLIGATFQSLTQDQANTFGVEGQQIRMDSKLIGSNIATCCRLQLVIDCIQQLWTSLKDTQRNRVCAQDQEVLNGLCQQKPHQVVYRLSSEQKRNKLSELGVLLSRLVETYSDNDSDQYELIRRVFADQYRVSSAQKEVLPKPSAEIDANSLQSVHDEDATFRRKGDQKVKGYSVNLTETCNDAGLNLITDVDVQKATVPDTEFVQPAIERTQHVVGAVQAVSMDGAYNSPQNSAYAEKEHKQFHFSGLQGATGRFIFQRTEAGVEVIDRHTGEVQLAQEYKPGKYKILIDGKTRYFKERDIDNSLRRQQVEDLPVHIRNRRNNVEASIFQLTYYTNDGQTRYRGLIPHQVWAWCRAAWINLVRIKNYLTVPDTSVQGLANRAKQGLEKVLFACQAAWHTCNRCFFNTQRLAR